MATARARARSVEDCASANAMWATHAARRKPSERDWASIDAALREGESRVERKGTDGTMVALVGARTLAALTRFRSEEALEAEVLAMAEELGATLGGVPVVLWRECVDPTADEAPNYEKPAVAPGGEGVELIEYDGVALDNTSGDELVSNFNKALDAAHQNDALRPSIEHPYLRRLAVGEEVGHIRRLASKPSAFYVRSLLSERDCDAIKAMAHVANMTQARTYGGGTTCLLYTSPSPRDQRGSRMASSA